VKVDDSYATARPLYLRERNPVPLLQVAGWDPGPVWTGAENLYTGILCNGWKEKKTEKILSTHFSCVCVSWQIAVNSVSVAQHLGPCRRKPVLRGSAVWELQFYTKRQFCVYDKQTLWKVRFDLGSRKVEISTRSKRKVVSSLDSTKKDLFHINFKHFLQKCTKTVTFWVKHSFSKSVSHISKRL
jgi:hypothetical protein